MKKILQQFFSFLKGLKQDPFLCLGLIAAVLFVLTSLLAGFVSTNSSQKEDFSLASLANLSDKTAGEEPFLSPAKGFSPESPEFLLVGDNSLKSATPPTNFSPQVLGALVAGYETIDTRKVVTEYMVEAGDTLSSIASTFEISLNTLLWANNLSKNSTLKVGQKLVILPVSGVLYHVKTGDTVSNIANTYKGKTDEILAFNGLAGDADIYVGDILIIPNGVLPQAPSSQPAPQLVPLAQSYFICPILTPSGFCRRTQGLHFYNAVDFSNSQCGEPIFAAAEGEVIKVKLTESISRWAFGGAGNTIAILHPNGVVTSYGHVAASLVSVGQHVSQGQIIALMGGMPGTPGAGLSTGCHTHFQVMGARNPFAQ